MEHLPYIDQVWFGEEFNPDWEPEFWLVEMSGIPFGLFGEMLQNPNPWRGMLFGMTAREHYSGPSPLPLWKLWTESGMSSSHMLGWWRQDCPVKTGRADVPATVYRGKGKALIAVTSWSKDPAKVKLKIDSRALGLTPRKLSAPGKLEGFQPAAQYGPADSDGDGSTNIEEIDSDAGFLPGWTCETYKSAQNAPGNLVDLVEPLDPGCSGVTTTTTITTTTLPGTEACGQPISSGPTPVATDCLLILQAAVGSQTCSPECVCAPTGALPVKATDALLCLWHSVGDDSVPLQCPCSS